MTPEELDNRIKKAKETIENYPEWVKGSMIFQGTGVQRGDNENK